MSFALWKRYTRLARLLFLGALVPLGGCLFGTPKSSPLPELFRDYSEWCGEVKNFDTIDESRYEPCRPAKDWKKAEWLGQQIGGEAIQELEKAQLFKVARGSLLISCATDELYALRMENQVHMGSQVVPSTFSQTIQQKVDASIEAGVRAAGTEWTKGDSSLTASIALKLKQVASGNSKASGTVTYMRVAFNAALPKTFDQLRTQRPELEPCAGQGEILIGVAGILLESIDVNRQDVSERDVVAAISAAAGQSTPPANWAANVASKINSELTKSGVVSTKINGKVFRPWYGLWYELPAPRSP